MTINEVKPEYMRETNSCLDGTALRVQDALNSYISYQTEPDAYYTGKAIDRKIFHNVFIIESQSVYK